MITEAQRHHFLSTPTALKINFFDQKSCHKWLGCMLIIPIMMKKRHDVDHHLPAASKAVFRHRATLCDRNVSIRKRVRYFDAVVSPVAVFAAGHRTMYKTDLAHNVLFRKLLRSVVDPLQAWIRHVHGMKPCMTGMVESMNLRPFMASSCAQNMSKTMWSAIRLAHYISSLDDQRWVKRLMAA